MYQIVRHYISRMIPYIGSRVATVIALSLGMFLLSICPGWSQYGPFAELPGSWVGSGTIIHKDGKAQQISCRAFYVIGSDGNELQQNLKCVDSLSADGFSIELRSNVMCRGGSLSGTWSETNSKQSGTVSGRAGGGVFVMSTTTDNFSAELKLI
jgi:hypothetical protein